MDWWQGTATTLTYISCALQWRWCSAGDTCDYIRIASCTCPAGCRSGVVSSCMLNQDLVV